MLLKITGNVRTFVDTVGLWVKYYKEKSRVSTSIAIIEGNEFVYV